MGSSQFVRAKIVCTIGPTSTHPRILRAMVDAGMDVARLNLSHGDFDTHRRVVEADRKSVETPPTSVRVSTTRRWVSKSPWERFNRAMSIPASTIALRILGWVEVGPMVQTIFALTNWLLPMLITRRIGVTCF